MPDNAKIWLERAPGEPCIMVPYSDGGGYSYWRPSAKETEFEVNADIAAAAIATGYFVERVGSKTTLRAQDEAPQGGE